MENNCKNGKNCLLRYFLGLYVKVVNIYILVIAPIMTPLLWTLEAIHICLSTSSGTNHYEGGRDWGRLTKMLNGHCHLSQVCWNRTNSKLVGRRTLTSWRRRPWYKRALHQYPEATRRTLVNEVHSWRFRSQTITSPTFKPGEQEHTFRCRRQVQEQRKVVQVYLDRTLLEMGKWVKVQSRHYFCLHREAWCWCSHHLWRRKKSDWSSNQWRETGGEDQHDWRESCWDDRDDPQQSVSWLPTSKQQCRSCVRGPPSKGSRSLKNSTRRALQYIRIWWSCQSSRLATIPGADPIRSDENRRTGSSLRWERFKERCPLQNSRV